MSLEFYSFGNAKLLCGLGLLMIKMLKQGSTKVGLGPYIVENAKTRYH